MASNRNSVQEEMPPKSCQESQDIMSPEFSQGRSKKRLLRIQGLPQKIQRSKRSMLSKLPRDSSVQELPREVRIIRSLVFSSHSHFLYCKRPINGVIEPIIVKAKFVQACNQRKGPSHIVEHVMNVSVTCLSCALILHHSRNSP